MTANIVNKKENDTIYKIPSKRTKQNLSDSLSRNSDSSDESDYKAKDAIKKELPEKETGHYQIMHKINGKVADNNV